LLSASFVVSQLCCQAADPPPHTHSTLSYLHCTNRCHLYVNLS
jgi:hypothetical protein